MQPHLDAKRLPTYLLVHRKSAMHITINNKLLLSYRIELQQKQSQDKYIELVVITKTNIVCTPLMLVVILICRTKRISKIRTHYLFLKALKQTLQFWLITVEFLMSHLRVGTVRTLFTHNFALYKWHVEKLKALW